MVNNGRMVNGTWYPPTSNTASTEGASANFNGGMDPADGPYNGFPGPNPFFASSYGYGMPQSWMMGGGGGGGGGEGQMMMGGMMGQGPMIVGGNGMGGSGMDVSMMQQNMMMYMQMQQYMQQQMQGPQGGQGMMDGQDMQGMPPPPQQQQQMPPQHQPPHLQQQGGVPPPHAPPQQPLPSNYRPGTFLESDLVAMHTSTADASASPNEGLPEVLRHLSLSPSQSELSNTSTAPPVMSALVSEASCSSLPSVDAESAPSEEAHNAKENVSAQRYVGEGASPEKLEREKGVDERIRLIREKNARAEQKRMMALAEAEQSEDGSSTTGSVQPAPEAPRFGGRQQQQQQQQHQQPHVQRREGGHTGYAKPTPTRGMGRGGRGAYSVRGGRGGVRGINDVRLGVKAAADKNEGQDDGWRTVAPRSSRARSSSKGRVQRPAPHHQPAVPAV